MGWRGGPAIAQDDGIMGDTTRETPVAKVLEEYRETRRMSRRIILWALALWAGGLVVSFLGFGLQVVDTPISNQLSEIVHAIGLVCTVFGLASIVLTTILLTLPIAMIFSLSAMIAAGALILKPRLRRMGFDWITREEVRAIVWSDRSAVTARLIPAHDALLIPGVAANADGLLEVILLLRVHRSALQGRREDTTIMG